MIEMKCPFCGKFLGVLDGVAQIKCPRCRRLYTYSSRQTPDPEPDPDQDTGEITVRLPSSVNTPPTSTKSSQ